MQRQGAEGPLENPVRVPKGQGPPTRPETLRQKDRVSAANPSLRILAFPLFSKDSFSGRVADVPAKERIIVDDFFTAFNDVLGVVDDFIWGVPLMVLILFGGLLLTIRVKGLQFRQLPRALRYMFKNEEGGVGEVSSFGALCTALSATIGTGNIVGVATAIVAGGPGALFWMWIAALVGMATKYSEGLLAVKYRSVDKETGHVLGGPFYYIERGMGKNWKWLAKLFAFFGACAGIMGIGTITQVNSISGSVTSFFDPDKSVCINLFGMDYSIATVITAVAVAALVALVVIGGIRRIAKVSEKVIPTMVVIYVVFALVLVICNIDKLPGAFVVIFESAFGVRAAAGGALGAIIIAMQKGIARGIFSNEAGLGSAPIAAAAAQTREPVRQGLVSMTGTFLDTIIVCSMTGLAIVMTGTYEVAGLEGAGITTAAFQAGLPFLPSQVVSAIMMLCLVLFGFTTILGWDYYAERCLEYLSNGKQKVVTVYRWLYVLAVLIGPFLTVSAVWTIADIFNGLMALPNMIALIALSGVVAKETKDYFKRLSEAEDEDHLAPRPKEDWEIDPADISLRDGEPLG